MSIFEISAIIASISFAFLSYYVINIIKNEQKDNKERNELNEYSIISNQFGSGKNSNKALKIILDFSYEIKGCPNSTCHTNIEYIRGELSLALFEVRTFLGKDTLPSVDRLINYLMPLEKYSDIEKPTAISMCEEVEEEVRAIIGYKKD